MHVSKASVHDQQFNNCVFTFVSVQLYARWDFGASSALTQRVSALDKHAQVHSFFNDIFFWKLKHKVQTQLWI